MTPDMIEHGLQAVIALTGAAAVWLITREAPWSRWGFVVGLIGQPFWLVSTAASGQWGMFALSLLYLWIWADGVWREFFNHRKETMAAKRKATAK